jgi:proteic killer suppression protein
MTARCSAAPGWPGRKSPGSTGQLDSVDALDQLKIPPGNRLETLSGDRAGQYSIRINQQYRICFTWTDNEPDNVEIVDYH